VKVPLKLFEDNLGCISLAKTPENRQVKDTDIKYHIIWEKLLGKEMFVKSENQLPDTMTKGLSKTCFESLLGLSAMSVR
jgi:hypothetical protein